MSCGYVYRRRDGHTYEIFSPEPLTVPLLKRMIASLERTVEKNPDYKPLLDRVKKELKTLEKLGAEAMGRRKRG